MKKKLAVCCCILMSLLLVAACALAEGWKCPSCGAQNEGNFCSNCGEKKPEKKQKFDGTDISNIRFSLEDNGDVVVTWDDMSDSSSYIVAYEAAYDTGYWDGIKERKFALEYMIPGETYTVYVNNGSSEASETYTVPIRIFTDYSTKKEIKLNETRFSISEVNRDKTKQYEFQVHYPQLRNSRLYKAKLVVKTPLGYSGHVTIWRNYELERGYDYYRHSFSIYDFFEDMKSDFDKVPTGRYTFEFYFDGRLYDDFSFTVVD